LTLDTIAESISQLKASKDEMIEKKGDLFAQSSSFDGQISHLDASIKNARQALEAQGLELLGAKDALNEWLSNNEGLARSIGKKVQHYFLYTLGISNGIVKRKSNCSDSKM
jgi:hypothetical protein